MVHSTRSTTKGPKRIVSSEEENVYIPTVINNFDQFKKK
jgi:hypothetical protein